MARRATANSSGAKVLYFCGIAPAPDAATGAEGTTAFTGATTTPLAGPGIAPAPEGLGIGSDAPVAGRSRMLVAVAFGRSFEV